MTKFWQRVIAVIEVVGGVLALSATIFAARAGSSKSNIILGATLDSLVLVAGVTLWFRSATGVLLSELAIGLQSVQVFTGWFVWQYVAGAALLVQIIGGKIHWSGGVLVRHTFSLGGEGDGTGLGVNVVAIAALVFLIMARRRGKSLHQQGTA